MAGLRERMAGVSQVQPEQRKLIADLPAQVQLNAINQIIAGKKTRNQQVNSFVQQSAARGMKPEQIRQAFIAEQRRSPNPLLILGG